MHITLTFKALSVRVGSEYALRWALTLEIYCRSSTVVIGFELSRVGSSVLTLII